MRPHAPQPLPAGESADEMLAQLAAQGAAPVGRYGQDLAPASQRAYATVVGQANRGRGGVAKLRYTHEDCIDRILASPGIHQNDLAQLYGVTPAWMSIVINCDAFKVKLAERKAELVDPILAASLNERFGALAARSVEVLLEKLSKPVNEISDKLALEAASLGARATGQGVAPTPAVNATDHLAALAHRLVDLNRSSPPTLDVQAREVRNGS